MNILVLADAFWPDDVGGISKSILPEVEGLVARGHRVAVVTRRLEPSFEFYERRAGYAIYRYPCPFKGTISYPLYPLFSIKNSSRLINRLHKEFHFDVAYVHNPFQAVGLLRASVRVPYVYVFHAPTPREIEIDAARGKYGLATPLVETVNRWIKSKEKRALMQASAIIVRSAFMEMEMRQLYGDVEGEIFRIPLGVDTRHFSFTENPRVVRETLGLPPDRPLLLTVRRLVARMGLENLIAAMRLVANQIPEALLLIGGKGYLENALRQQVKELGLERNVKLSGFIPEEKLPLYYQAADLFVLPSTALEGFGLVTIEALSCGTPVVATPVGANHEVLGPLGEEFLTRGATPEALAERIICFIKRGIGAELRRRCRAYCEASFGANKVVGHIERVLQAVVKKYGVAK